MSSETQPPRPSPWRFSIREIMLLTAAVAGFLAWANLAYQRSRPYRRTPIPDTVGRFDDIQRICTEIGHRASSLSSGGGGSGDPYTTTRTYECRIDLPKPLRPEFMKRYRERLRAMLDKHAENVSGAGTTSDGTGLRGFEYDYRQGRARGTVIVRTSGSDEDFFLFLFIHEFDGRD
ncbi:MAG TPA: hypothetical protein VFV87_11330 [Pirellulaceae bacterium]|nr:hypothetical protein [Pirellulaceae bacterium]